MKKLLQAVYILLAVSVGAFAQNHSSTQSLSQLKNDYKQVAIVAHVKITGIKFAAEDVHPLYVVESEVIEPFKGRIKRGQRLVFYIHIEHEGDLNRLLGTWVVFLEGKNSIPPGGKGWYELENSRLASTKLNIGKMRKIRDSRTRTRTPVPK